MTLTTVELFAGVGGFRLGLEGQPGAKNPGPFRVIWANQWEPSVRRQHAAEIYSLRWNLKENEDDCEIFTNGLDDVLLNKDIEKVLSSEIPNHDLLCGGFPCQDYSVARTRSGEMGIKGEKGKLWTSIRRIIKKSKPRIVFLENVPRLLNSPAVHRGLNFTVILNDLIDLGYDVEWRVINAADYGFPQKRKRIFIVAYLCGSVATPTTHPSDSIQSRIEQWIGVADSINEESSFDIGPICQAFPIIKQSIKGIEKITLDPNPRNQSPYQNTGYAWKDEIGNFCMLTAKTKADYSGKHSQLRDVIESSHNADYEVIDQEKLRRYRYIKGQQKEWRIRKVDMEKAKGINAEDNDNLWDLYQRCTKGYATHLWVESRENPGYKEGVKLGIIYDYTAGAMAYPDSLDKPSRTVVTAEIGKSVSRMRHIIEYEKGKYRRLIPLELERLNMFPDNWTEYEGISDSRRGFLMGNALVVGIVERLAGPLAKLIRDRREQ
jgi:DNA (cytosine-5)-methyltransferase 1